MSVQIQSKVNQERKCGNPVCRQPGHTIRNCNHESAIQIKTEFEIIGRFCRAFSIPLYLKGWLDTLSDIDLNILGGLATVRRELNIKKLFNLEYNDILTQRPNNLGRPYNDADMPLIERFINDQIRFALSSFSQEEIHQPFQQVITRGFRHLITHLLVESLPDVIQNKFPLIKLTNAIISPLQEHYIFNSDQEPIACPICFDELTMETDAAMTQCEHIYCSPCIETFFKHLASSQSIKEPCCAMCRTDITQITFNKYSTFTNFANTHH